MSEAGSEGNQNPGGEGGGDGGGAPAGAAGGEGGGGGDGGGTPAAAAPYRPDGLDEQFHGTTDNETIDRLSNAYSGAREALGKFGDIPKSADDYKIELSAEAQAAFPVGDDDPVMPILRQAALDNGLTNKQMAFIPSLVDGLIKGGVIEAPVTGDAVFAGLVPEGFEGDDAAKMKAGSERQSAAETYVNSLSAEAGFTDGIKEELNLLAFTPNGLAALELLKGNGMTETVNTGGAPAGDLTSEALDARMADPKNDRNKPEYSKSFAEETQAMFKKLYNS